MFKAVLYWTEKATGTKWFDRRDTVTFRTEVEREAWLNDQPKGWAVPRNRFYMPLEIAERSRTELPVN